MLCLRHRPPRTEPDGAIPVKNFTMGGARLGFGRPKPYLTRRHNQSRHSTILSSSDWKHIWNQPTMPDVNMMQGARMRGQTRSFFFREVCSHAWQPIPSKTRGASDPKPLAQVFVPTKVGIIPTLEETAVKSIPVLGFTDRPLVGIQGNRGMFATFMVDLPFLESQREPLTQPGQPTLSRLQARLSSGTTLPPHEANSIPPNGSSTARERTTLSASTGFSSPEPQQPWQSNRFSSQRDGVTLVLCRFYSPKPVADCRSCSDAGAANPGRKLLPLTLGHSSAELCPARPRYLGANAPQTLRGWVDVRRKRQVGWSWVKVDMELSAEVSPAALL